jgi:hypothetical protein
MVRGRQVSIVIAIAGFVCACGTAAQRESRAIGANNIEASQNLRACGAGVYNTPAEEPLRAHAPFDIRDATLQQLTDKSLATDVEVAAILQTHPQIQGCRKAFLDEISQLTPSVGAIFMAQFTKIDDSLMDLIQKKQSWGEHEQRVRAAYEDGVSQNVAEMHRINADLQQSNQIEVEQRQQAAGLMMQYLQTQQMINSMNQPVITNCNAFGNSVNCISR